MDQPETGICFPVAGLLLAAPAYLIPSQGLMRAHFLLRSAALSACGTVCVEKAQKWIWLKDQTKKAVDNSPSL